MSQLPRPPRPQSDRPPWTPALAIRRKERELAETRRVARALLRFEATERRAATERPQRAPHCPWCGARIGNESRSCSAHSDLDRLLLGHVTKRR